MILILFHEDVISLNKYVYVYLLHYDIIILSKLWDSLAQIYFFHTLFWGCKVRVRFFLAFPCAAFFCFTKNLRCQHHQDLGMVKSSLKKFLLDYIIQILKGLLLVLVELSVSKINTWFRMLNLRADVHLVLREIVLQTIIQIRILKICLIGN